MYASPVHADPLDTMLLEALEAELGAVAVYDAAVRCAIKAELRSEWTECLIQAESRRDDLLHALRNSGVDSGQAVAGREVIAQVSLALLQSIESRIEQGDRADAQDMALECARLMKRRDRIDWQLLAMAVDAVSDEEVEDEGVFETAAQPAPQLETMTPYSSAARQTRASNEAAVAA
jgi:hypothetical protein